MIYNVTGILSLKMFTRVLALTFAFGVKYTECLFHKGLLTMHHPVVLLLRSYFPCYDKRVTAKKGNMTGYLLHPSLVALILMFEQSLTFLITCCCCKCFALSSATSLQRDSFSLFKKDNLKIKI